MFLYRLVDLWRCLWQMTRKSITWPWSGCRLSLRRNLSPDQALVLYTHKNDVDWSRGSSCILFDMLSLHSSTAWKLNKIPWFFWGKKSLSKTKAINRIYPLTCRIILCLKLKKKKRAFEKLENIICHGVEYRFLFFQTLWLIVINFFFCPISELIVLTSHLFTLD